MTIGERIRSTRIDIGLTQDELAKKLGYKNKSAICRVEKDYEQNLTLDRVSAFAKALGVTEAYLMGWTDNDNENIMIEEFKTGEFLGTITTDKKFVSMIEKLYNLSPDKKDFIFNQIDYLYNQEDHE